MSCFNRLVQLNEIDSAVFTQKQEFERQEFERQEFERQEFERQEFERQEFERQEFERQEFERQEFERQQTGDMSRLGFFKGKKKKKEVNAGVNIGSSQFTGKHGWKEEIDSCSYYDQVPSSDSFKSPDGYKLPTSPPTAKPANPQSSENDGIYDSVCDSSLIHSSNNSAGKKPFKVFSQSSNDSNDVIKSRGQMKQDSPVEEMYGNVDEVEEIYGDIDEVEDTYDNSSSVMSESNDATNFQQTFSKLKANLPFRVPPHSGHVSPNPFSQGRNIPSSTSPSLGDDSKIYTDVASTMKHPPMGTDFTGQLNGRNTSSNAQFKPVKEHSRVSYQISRNPHSMPLPPLPSEEIYDDPSQPLPQSNRNDYMGRHNMPLPPPPSDETEDIYEDTINTVSKPLPQQGTQNRHNMPLPPPPSNETEDIYEDTSNTVSKPLPQQGTQNWHNMRLLPPPPDETEDIYEDTSNTVSKPPPQHGTINRHNMPLPSHPSDEAEDIYEDTSNTVSKPLPQQGTQNWHNMSLPPHPSDETEDIYEDTSNTVSKPLPQQGTQNWHNMSLPPHPSDETEDIYEDTSNTVSKPLPQQGTQNWHNTSFPPPPSDETEDIYEDTSNTVSKPSYQGTINWHNMPLPSHPSDEAENIYDDVSNAPKPLPQSSSGGSRYQYNAPLPPPPSCIAEDLYEDTSIVTKPPFPLTEPEDIYDDTDAVFGNKSMTADPLTNRGGDNTSKKRGVSITVQTAGNSRLDSEDYGPLDYPHSVSISKHTRTPSLSPPPIPCRSPTTKLTTFSSSSSLGAVDGHGSNHLRLLSSGSDVFVPDVTDFSSQHSPYKIHPGTKK